MPVLQVSLLHLHRHQDLWYSCLYWSCTCEMQNQNAGLLKKKKQTNHKTLLLNLTANLKMMNYGVNCCGTLSWTPSCGRQYHIQTLIHSLPIQVTADASVKATDHGPSAWARAVHMGDPDEVPDFSLAQWPSGPSQEWIRRWKRSLSASVFSPSLPATLPFQ